MLRDLLCVAPLKKKKKKGWHHFSSKNVLFLDLLGLKLNDSQREYAWQGEADDLIWVCVVIN